MPRPPPPPPPHPLPLFPVLRLFLPSTYSYILNTKNGSPQLPCCGNGSAHITGPLELVVAFEPVHHVDASMSQLTSVLLFGVNHVCAVIAVPPDCAVPHETRVKSRQQLTLWQQNCRATCTPLSHAVLSTKHPLHSFIYYLLANIALSSHLASFKKASLLTCCLRTAAQKWMLARGWATRLS